MTLQNFTGCMGGMVINACVKYRKKIFIGVGDIHPDGQISDDETQTGGWMDGQKDGAQIIIPHQKKSFGGG